ncbi:MAG: methyltransferase domain-containing protein [Myxococcales bacterium]
MRRRLEPELLDSLDPSAPLAVGSRRDLRRLNTVMGNHRLLAEALRRTVAHASRPRVVDLATGDGTLVSRVAQALGPLRGGGQLFLVDLFELVTAGTRAGLEALGWQVTLDSADALSWLSTRRDVGFDAIIANLFLHHLPEPTLTRLLGLVARHARTFAAVEPRRGPWPLSLSRLVGLLGCNPVTRHDAPASVRGGFTGRELSGLWPDEHGWTLQERPAGLASHVFVAERSELR